MRSVSAACDPRYRSGPGIGCFFDWIPVDAPGSSVEVQMKREDSSLSALRRLPPGSGHFIRFGSVPDQHPAIIPRYREIRRSDAARPVRSAWFPLSFRSAMRCSLNIAMEHCRTPHARFTMIAAPPLFAGLRRMNPISSYALSTARLRASVQRQQQHEK
ncbi:hypothetical protein BBSC_0710 [Bifidobacterium scardovii JCM 12489 = DSM 13734]|nr:hypothetical protein BBSC_0710 [Bifidobacterium scardovii JCM 12489 = DSM 13734]